MDLWLLDYILGSIISIVSSISFFHCEVYIPIFFRNTSKERWLFVKQEQHEAMLTEKLMLAAQAAGGGAAKSAPWLASGISNSLQIQFHISKTISVHLKFSSKFCSSGILYT